ncbi:MAG: hypothetical protein H7039_05680 [Bryobacteraceae bacterium]|nr:hypothetical protein [Bryobacteraceae bacterium]
MHRFLIAGLLSAMACTAAVQISPVLVKSGTAKAGLTKVPLLVPEMQYSFLYSLPDLKRLTQDSRVSIEIRQGAAVLAKKTLHAGDPDFYVQIRVPGKGDAIISVAPGSYTGTYSLQVNKWPLSRRVKAGPSHRWQDAMAIDPGTTVFAYGDEAEYIPVPETPRRTRVEDPVSTDWFRFEFDGIKPKLIFFQVELTERDQVPSNVSVFRIKDGKPEEYFEGEDPVTFPHEVQALPGNKFTPRILREKGTYYVAIRSSHPEYKLRTRLYDPPPYSSPEQAVRTGLDYILAAGDSWHANTPRRGGTIDRTSSVHQETSLCVACHATHFPQRAQLYAARNGYPVVQRQQLQFLSERFYNNPRPFYGFEETATWARMISAGANVLGRMSHLMDLFEAQISGEPRKAFHKGIAGYLDVYYKGRDKLPSDETNGNTPLVSAHEVAWYAWTATKDPAMADRIARGEVKNVIDLCYQTLALADIAPEKYRSEIAANAQRLLSLQRADGQWSSQFDAKQPSAEFQTGHALWALHEAGVPITNEGVAKGLKYLLGRQQGFGGWMDPLQSFENFRTPFRETQMSILALSAWYPRPTLAPGWNSRPTPGLSEDPVTLLEQLDEIWDAPSAEVRGQIEAATRANDALIRQAATEALGRLGIYSDAYPTLLGDPSKMVQRTAAWALRQTYSRHSETPSAPLLAALSASSDRTRWGASRVFATHFAALATRPEIADALLLRNADEVLATRVNAIRGLWQFWFWTPATPVKERIEDALLASLGKSRNEWVTRNLDHAIYNIADENIRYLYNNWIPLIAGEDDRARAVKGRLAVESRLATKFANLLKNGSTESQQALLGALTEFPLRRGDVYNLDADLGTAGPPVYNRIGNDIEQIAFFGQSRERMAEAILPLLHSSNAETRRLASKAVLLVREMRFADVNRIAGPAGPIAAKVAIEVESVPEGLEVARVLKPAPPPTAGTPISSNGKRAAVPAKLDEAYFRGYVEPILQKRGKDGYACVHCHATHTLFDGNWSTVRNVVNTAEPESSLLLRKPTSSSETEGIANSATLAHGGGVRFAKDSPEYIIILDWIKGSKE